MACLGRLSIHLVRAILAWFREAEVLAPAIPEWTGTRALIDPFPPPPLKLPPPPDISMASDRITMAMPWAIAPSPLLVDGSVPIWFTDSTHALLSSGLPLILDILIGCLLYARCSASACGPIDFDRASCKHALFIEALDCAHVSPAFSADVSVRRSERSRVGPLPPRLNYRSTAINDSRKASPHYEQLGGLFLCCRRARRRNVRKCRQCLFHLRRVRLSKLVVARRQYRQRSNAPKGWISAVVHRLKDFFGRRSLQGAAVSFALIALCVAGFHLANGSVAVVASMNRSFDQILDFKDAFWFGCWDALDEGSVKLATFLHDFC